MTEPSLTVHIELTQEEVDFLFDFVHDEAQNDPGAGIRASAQAESLLPKLHKVLSSPQPKDQPARKLDQLDQLEDAIVEFREGRIDRDEFFRLVDRAAPKITQNGEPNA